MSYRLWEPAKKRPGRFWKSFSTIRSITCVRSDRRSPPQSPCWCELVDSHFSFSPQPELHTKTRKYNMELFRERHTYVYASPLVGACLPSIGERQQENSDRSFPNRQPSGCRQSG